VLSPFVVDAAEDKGSYKANSTLAGTRVRTDLKDVASAITVVTAQFLQDTGAKNAQDLLVYTPSTEVAGLRGNFSGAAGAAVVQENTVSATTRVRGLDSADNTRDYFLTDIPWDAFNVGRVDLQRGPNSILFGTGSPAGIINVSTNGASFNNSYNITNRFDEYGSLRDSASLNQEIIPGVLAIRLSVLKDDEKYEQSDAFNDTNRYYGAFRFDPKLFGKDSHTSIRGNYEYGKQTSNNPRDLPPTDEITPWFASTISIGGVTNPGYNKQLENQFSLTNVNPSGGPPLPGGTGGPLDSAMFVLGGWAEGRSYWADVINYFEATPVANNNVANAQNPSGTPIKVITAEANQGLVAAFDGYGGASIGGISGFRPVSVPPFSLIAGYIGTQGASPGNGVPANYRVPTNPIPGGVYYTDKVLTDPTIFNFYKKLLDGPNKHEWKNWSAFNMALDQTFFDDRLGFEFAYDQQKYTEGAEPWLEGENYAISIDPNVTYADGTLNPNVGRPMVAQASSGGEDNNYQTTTTRQTYRFTPTAELRASDFFGNSTLSKILGKSDFTGLYEKTTVVNDSFQFAEYATTPDFLSNNNLPSNNITNAVGSNGSFEWVAYIGPALQGYSSAHGLNLNAINYVMAPPKNETTLNFNSAWNKPTDPNTPGYVNPTAPYSYTNTDNGVVTTNSIQYENPANYVGWQNEEIGYQSWSDPSDRSNLITAGNRSRYTDESKGITWQGYFLDGDLVPSLGWRKDTVTNYQSTAVTNSTTGITSLDYPDNLASRTDVSGISKTWGGVYHVPKSIMARLPYDMTFSVFMNRSENFKPDAARLSMAGLPIPNAVGNTTEYGFTTTALNDKLSLKVDWFKTIVKNADLAGTNGNSIAGLGSNGYFLADGVIWGYGWAAALQDGLAGKTPNTNYWDYGNGSGYATGSAQYIATNAASAAIVNAWLNIPLPDAYFGSFNVTPPIIPSLAKASGKLDSAFLQGYNDLTAPNEGGGSDFGDHVTTVDNLSKGIELEISAQPTRNWNITLNYSKVNATHSNVDPAAQAFISKLTGFMNGPGGQIRMWCNSCGTLGADWNSSIVAPFTVLLNDQGHEAPEVAPWRMNAITTYTFDRGVAKGVFIGGALRIEAARILGYKYNPNFNNVNSADPNYANVLAVTEGGLDVNQPFRGTNDTHVDAWIGYSRKVYRNVNWRVQLNIRSVGEKDHLVAAGIEPDGSLALARIQLGMGWSLENSFDF
jgi:outer membrane receptor for ferric coprogen and ferric-rhodotorulic acid